MENKRYSHDHHREGRGGIEQLLCRNAGILMLLPPEILRGHDCAAGGKGREDLNEQDIDGIHQRNSGHGGLANTCDHDCIRHADRDG